MKDRIELWHDSEVLGGIDLLRAECRTCRYDAHAHDAFVIAAFRAGAQKYSIAGARGVTSPGTVMIIPPGEVHTGERAARDGGWIYSALYPSAAALDRLSSELFTAPHGGLDLGTTFLIEDEALAQTLLSAVDVAARSAEAMRRQEAIGRALALLVRRHGRSTRPLAPRRLVPAPIQRGIDYIMGNLDRRLAIAEVAIQVGLSEFHVMRLFKARTGMTVHQYVVHRRLEAARAALARGIPPAEAAARYGFYDQSHFTGHFRRAFGTTPRRYADACR
ncbi:helix-turn-helix transcriptional regulator [Methylobacterium indicum]|uniref:AraC family transcriptional regulator n=1 Tax=Methylobacterium indicum TaxID=1775910 RepID=A0A8H8WWL6_9HYPH|nr:AraC family transcriptional regulator [Methylobacterium indicum]BCM85841.1 AraC family transcriptional regulator [Methylobacterium indicum]